MDTLKDMLETSNGVTRKNSRYMGRTNAGGHILCGVQNYHRKDDYDDYDNEYHSIQ